ncbi:DegT/DnrJ/EryC1/StrS family aminotransferase [Desulfohalovibrio reitneri]|uniref:DegT/DnrJ/EryC1/StrS family aminotransferase n=1 Tax=Desulfohalovibrio reitneri TaxID=1307759 RepID=UPI0004A6E03C|nr:DegT/DnrJ/EryC1/StrS family aminotransferase [Desulfohalovibrio reitneri]
MAVPFNDLAAQLAPQRAEINAALARVLDSGWFLGGRETEAFEREFADWSGLAGTVACASGTDALTLALEAVGVSPGEEVILPALTAPPCYHAVLAVGAIPAFCEVDPETLTITPKTVEAATSDRTRAVLAVHLYGSMADMRGLDALCREQGLYLIEDCAQAHGASRDGLRAGETGDAACFSFYPTKNLGALGDAGAICSQSADRLETLRLLRQYGEHPRYVSTRPGYNSRIDETQAAALRTRLPRLAADNAERRRLAGLYAEGLAGTPLTLPKVDEGHVAHLYAVRVPKREPLQRHLAEREIGTGVHYPVPGHRQPMFTLNRAPCEGALDLSFTETVVDELLSLPLYPGLADERVEEVCAAVREHYGV